MLTGLFNNIKKKYDNIVGENQYDLIIFNQKKIKNNGVETKNDISFYTSDERL